MNRQTLYTVAAVVLIALLVIIFVLYPAPTIRGDSTPLPNDSGPLRAYRPTRYVPLSTPAPGTITTPGHKTA